MNTTMNLLQNASASPSLNDFVFDTESLYIGVGVGVGLMFSLALLSLVAAVACLGQRRRGGVRTDRLTSAATLARSDFDSYKSGSHYYVSNSINEIVRDEVRQIRKQPRPVPTWPIAHALPSSPTTSAARSLETCSDLEDVEEIVTEETKVKKFRSRSSSWGRRRKGNNSSRRPEVRRVSESAIRLPEVKSVFGGSGVSTSSSGSHSLATLSLNLYKPHVRLSELEKYREAQNGLEISGSR